MNIEQTKAANVLIERLENLKRVKAAFIERKNKKPEKGEPSIEPSIVFACLTNTYPPHWYPSVVLPEDLYDKVVHFIETITESELLALGVTK